MHHALCAVTEPRFEGVFIPDSYANRVGRGTHKAIGRFREFSRRFRYVLRADIRQHFASIDHEILLAGLKHKIPEPDLMALIELILTSGECALRDEYRMVWFPGDDLMAQCRPRGLPIGNLTSQFWSNCYLHPLDLFVKRQLGCRGYLRYVDDFALFSDSKAELWAWKEAIRLALAGLRLQMHETSAQVVPVTAGIPWLGFVIFPERCLLKARKARHASRHLRASHKAYQKGEITFAELDARVQAWIGHASHGDTWGLRKHLFADLVLQPGDVPGKRQ